MHAYLFNASARNIKEINFRKIVPSGIENACLDSVCCCFSENVFLIFLFIYPKGG